MKSQGEWWHGETPEMAFDGQLSTAVKIVEGFEPLDGQQIQAKQTILEFAEKHKDSLHRSCPSGHFTGSCWVVNSDASKGLVLLHAKAQKWLQPGGHADGDGRLQAVALKEALEETGIADLQVWPRAIDVDVHEVVDKRAKEIVHLHLDVRFLIKAPQSAVARRNHESLDLRWGAREELNDPRLALDPSTQRVANYGFALADQLMH